jgi:chaperonin GroES
MTTSRSLPPRLTPNAGKVTAALPQDARGEHEGVSDLPERTAVDGYRTRRLEQRVELDRGRPPIPVPRRLFMKLQPLGDRLIVEVVEEEELTEGGIVLPDTAKEKPQRGRVLAVGPGARDKDGKRIEMDVAEGDEVIFSKYGGTEIKLGSDDVLILRESDVLAKVTPSTSKSKRELAGATA